MLIAIIVLLSLILFNSFVIMCCSLMTFSFTNKLDKFIGKTLDIVEDIVKAIEKKKE